MADSIRLMVLRALCDEIDAEVTVANGHEFTLNGAVYRGRLYYGSDEQDADPLPMVSILEGLNPDRFPDSSNYDQNLQKDQWILLVQGWAPEDFENPTDPAHNLMAAVKTALGLVRRRIYEQQYPPNHPLRFVAGMTVEPGVVRPPDQMSDRAYFWMRVILTMVDDLADQYWYPETP